MFKESGQAEKGLLGKIKKIYEECRVCDKYQKTAGKPKVGLPKASEVNEVISVDLKPMASILSNPEDKRQLVYLVDEFSSFTVAGVARNKEAENVSKIILKKWCLDGPGYPSNGFFADNGTEFKKEYLEELARKLKVKIALSPSYSPWSNGKCERRHAAIDLTLKKLMEDDPTVTVEDALAHAVWARNCEIGRLGYSPFHLVYGKSPFIPGITDGDITTDGPVTEAESIRLHFSRQEKAREEFRKADRSRRLKEALNSRLQKYHDVKYSIGDRIIFQDKEKSSKWIGPGIVKVMEGKTIWITFNGNLRKVASCNARPFMEDSISTPVEEISIPQEDFPILLEDSSIPQEDSSILQEDSLSSLGDSSILTEEISDLDDISIQVVVEADNGKENPEQGEANEDKQRNLESIDCKTERRPKRHSTVRYRLHDEDFDRDGVVKKVGKKHTRNQDICWIERTDDGSKHLIAVDFMKDVEAWDYIKNSKVVFEESSDKNDAEKGRPLAEDESLGIFYLQRREPVEILATLVQSKDYGHPDIQDAMADELKKWRSYGAYEEVVDEEQTRINTRWVVNRKDIHDGLKVDVKARLCLRGFQELEKPRSDSPTVDRTSTRLLYAVAANENWPVVVIDVTSAFL